MKKLFAVSVCLSAFAFTSFGQAKPTKDTILLIPAAQCVACKVRIETYLKRVDGVMMVNLTPSKRQIRVKYLNDRTDVEAIKAHIANAGYQTGDVQANPDSYKLLPSTCRHKP